MAKAASVDKPVHLLGRVYGEIKAEDIPLPPGAQARMDALLTGDEDPLPVVVGVGVGKGGRGWRYMPEYLQLFVDRVNTAGMIGMLGHQRDEDIGHQFPQPVTHWLAARWDANAPVVDAEGNLTGDKGVAYFRGVVDKTAGDLKRWLRGRMVDQPSIFGMPVLEQQGSETVVRQGKPMSIDWAPLGRAGMATAQVLSMGEMDAIGGPAVASDPPQPRRAKTVGQTFRELVGELRDMNFTPAQALQEFGWRANDMIPALVQTDRHGLANALPRDVLANVAAGELAAAVDIKSLLPAYKADLASVAALVDGPGWERANSATKALGEIAALVGLAGDEAGDPTKVLAKVKEVNESVASSRKAAFRANVSQVVAAGEMAIPQPVRGVFTDMLVAELPQDATEEKIKTAVGEMKTRDTLKPLLGAQYAQQVPGTQATAAPTQTTSQPANLNTFDGAISYERRKVI